MPRLDELILTHEAELLDDRVVQLIGPKPPIEFPGNGCTGVPDFWFEPACRVHDYEYHLMRRALVDIKALRTNIKNPRLSDNLARKAKLEIRRLKSKLRHARYVADGNLKENMRLLSMRSLEESIVRQYLRWRVSWWLSKVYRTGVRLFGSFALRSRSNA